MTYDATPAPVNIKFEPGHKYHGAEAQLQGMSIGDYLTATGMDGGDGDDSAKTMNRFFTSLISWNLTYNGEPLPPTPEAARRADQRLIRALNEGYIQALTGVAESDPLPGSSTSGEPSQEASIPMEPLSESLVS